MKLNSLEKKVYAVTSSVTGVIGGTVAYFAGNEILNKSYDMKPELLAFATTEALVSLCLSFAFGKLVYDSNKKYQS